MKKVNPINQQNLDVHHELIIDLFAGGGGFSEGIKMASGRNPDIAINHNDDALSMHRVNHPDTRHFVADVFEVDPRTVTQGQPVGHLHASPDCTHHSQAAGGQPRNEKRRALSWVIIRWAGEVKPRVITMENVKQIKQWGPLIAKRDKETGRVVKLDGSIAEPGERVPREYQFLVPDPKRKGNTWRRFIDMLKSLGYDVSDTMMTAADYGAGTTRERLFLHARCDGKPVTFPSPTHFKNPGKGQKRWSAAHEHIDFSLPAKSIFERERPLADSTMRRIAKGIKRFVLDNPSPFIVQVTQSSSNGVRSALQPLPTITTAKGGEFAVVSPVMVQAGHGDGKPDGQKRWGMGAKSISNPVGAITASNGQALAMAHLQQYYGDKSAQGDNRSSDLNNPLRVQTTENRHALVTSYLARMKFDNIGAELKNPLPTITAGGNSARDAGAAHSLGLVAANLVTLRNNMDGADIDQPINTVTSSGNHHALVECHLSKEVEEKALRVSSFLTTYYGNGQEFSLDEPLATITTKDRLALVTVYYRGEPYVIVDITLRMLVPKELYSAQGLGKNYIFTHGHDGRKFSVSKQVKMVGNSVSPYPASALFSECHRGEDMLILEAA